MWPHDAEDARRDGALAAINDIRNSIVGTQTVNWSAHIYPLVKALEEAGIRGEGYDIAREKAVTLIDDNTRLCKVLTQAREALEDSNCRCHWRWSGDPPVERRVTCRRCTAIAAIDALEVRG